MSDRTMNAAGRLFIMLYALAGYLAFLAVFTGFILWSVGVVLPWTIDSGPLLFAVKGTWAAVAVNLGLIALFGAQHSVMARPGFKAWLMRLVPQPAERATFVWISSFMLALVIVCWQPLPRVIWEVDGTARGLLLGLNAAGWLFAIAATWMINHFDLFGLQQAWRNFRHQAPDSPYFMTRFAYRFVRHPLMTGIVLGLWIVPDMSAGHLVLSLGMTGYIMIGSKIEEGDLIRMFGERYRRYRERVPMLLPVPGRSVAPVVERGSSRD